MPTCDANTLAGLAACFNGLTPDQQKAIQTYLLCQLANGGGGGGSAVWGAITGTLSNQTDLNTALNAKLAKASNLSDVVSAATSFSNIKQAATTAATGVAELATVAEAGLGTDSSRIVTPGGIFPPEADVTSGTTTNIGAATTLLVRITGTTTITAFDTVAAGIRRQGRFAGILTLTHNATTLILPGGANITTAAGDTFSAYSLGSGNWVVSSYQKASGSSVVAVPSATTTNEGIAELATVAEAGTGTDTTRIVTPAGIFPAEADVSSNTTTNIGAAATSLVRITGTTTITAFDTVAAGIRRLGRFSGVLTLTYNGTSLILPGLTNIITAAGDTFEAYSLGSGNWVVTSYVRAAAAAVSTWDAIIKKPSNQDVVNSTTYASDTALVYPVATSSTYQVELCLIYKGTDSSSDFKCQFLYPSVAGVISPIGNATYYNTSGAGTTNFTAGDATVIPSGGSGLQMGTDPTANATWTAKISFMITTTSTSGNLTFQFACNSASGGTATVMAGSTLFVKKLA